MSEELERLRDVTQTLEPSFGGDWSDEPPEHFLHVFRGRPEYALALVGRKKAEKAVADRLYRIVEFLAAPRVEVRPHLETSEVDGLVWEIVCDDGKPVPWPGACAGRSII